MRTLSVLALLAAASVSSPAPAQALFLIESFDYGVSGSASIEGKGNSLGWASPWLGVDPAVPGLGSWWPLDGTATDVGVLSSHGLGSGVAYVSDTPAALSWSSKSAQFQGTEWIDLDVHAGKYQDLLRGTVSMWVKTTSTTQMAMLQFGRANEQIYAMLFLNDGYPAFNVVGDLNTNGVRLRSSQRVNDGQWHHVAWVSNGDGDVRIYIDGVEKGSRNEGFIGYAFGLDTMQSGRSIINGAEGDQYTGLIDDVAIWGDALDEADITALAQGTLPPIAITGPMTPPGPQLVAANLSPNAAPQGAFAGTGFKSIGNSFSDTSGQQAVRFMTQILDFQTDVTFYLSFLVRRRDSGGLIGPGEVRIAAPDGNGVTAGWNNNGKWTVGLRQSARSALTMQDDTTYFCVVKVVAQGFLPNSDRTWLKVYAPGEVVHRDDSAISGNGTGYNQWAINRVQANTAKTTALYLTQYPDSNGDFTTTFAIDEFRLGSTWQSVTRYGFGDGCLGVDISRTNRPVFGSNNFTVDLLNASPSAPAFLLGGASNQKFFGQQLPLDLTPFGGPGCELNVSIDFILPATTNAAGSAALAVPIPNLPVLSNFPLFVQWVAADLAMTNPGLPAALTEGMVIQVEN